VADVVVSAITTVHATQGAVPVEYDGEPGLRVQADHDRLGQAVENLLANAVRHGKPPVQVHAIRKGTTVRIEVADQGSGVKPEMQGRLFDRFATGRRRGGTGLGLFIVRELARAQGGDAFYEMPSVEHPSGAFVITLPAAVGLDR
jgi:signal transduction histidine kinase